MVDSTRISFSQQEMAEFCRMIREIGGMISIQCWGPGGGGWSNFSSKPDILYLALTEPDRFEAWCHRLSINDYILAKSISIETLTQCHGLTKKGVRCRHRDPSNYIWNSYSDLNFRLELYRSGYAYYCKAHASQSNDEVNHV